MRKKKDDGDVPPDARVRVAVRIRPKNRADHGDDTQCVTVEDQKITADNGQKSASFTFDHVFHNSSQTQVYKELGEQMLQDAFSGYNSTIFAYGQTGSGKTYSMVGVENDPDHEGLLPRICKELFDLSQELMAEDASLSIKIQVSFVEVYNEKIRDLLQFEHSGHPAVNDDLRDLRLKEDKKAKNFYVDGLSLHTVMNYGRVKNLIETGTELRTKAETGMNELSSRSHSVFTIYMHQTHDPPNPMHKDTESKITIVDLAGSERQSKTDITNAVQAAEAERINMSLLILGRCLSASSGSGKQHIPVRESVLTKMLMEIFGGNSKTIMFATISPAMFNFAESMSTLQYAHNAKKIKHKAKQNTLAKAIEVKELKEQVKALGKTLIEELEKAAQQKELMDKEICAITAEKELIAQELAASQAEIESLKQQIAELTAERDELRLRGPGTVSGPSTLTMDGVFGTVRNSRPADDDDSGSDQGNNGEDPDDRARKLQQIHEELQIKLPTMNPSLPGTARKLPDTASSHDLTRGGPEELSRTASTVTHEIRSYVGHGAAVYSCAFHPQGDKMVSASRDRTLKVWSVKSGTEIHSLKGHNGFVLCCVYSPNGNEICSASDDKTLKIWDGETGKKLVTLKGHNDKVYCCCYAPNGEQIASASCDKTVKVWDREQGKKRCTLRNHTSAVFSCNFSHDGKQLVSGSDDKTIRVWDWANNAELFCFQGHTGTVWSCEFSPTDEQVLSASMDGTVKLWDLETKQALRTYRGHSAPVHHAIFAKDGSKIVSASRDRSIKVWDTDSGRVVSTLVGHNNTVYRCCVFNNLILSCSSDDILKAWNLKMY
jgi:hypothetical protein